MLFAAPRRIHEELPFWQRVTTERRARALAAALLHDVGHGPFSHLFERRCRRAPRHEEWTRRIVLDPAREVNQILVRFDPALPARVADSFKGKHELTFLARAVSGTFDVDRCDYLLRDAHATGVGYGKFDLDWLLRSLCFGVKLATNRAVPPLAIDGAKGIPAIESFLLARLFMFQQVYFHKTERASEWMLARIFERVHQCILDGARLPGVPAALVSTATTGEATLGEYLELDDAVLWVLLAELGIPRTRCSRTCHGASTRGGCSRPSSYSENRRRPADASRRSNGPRGGGAARARSERLRRARCASTVAFDDSDDPIAVVFPEGHHAPSRRSRFCSGACSHNGSRGFESSSRGSCVRTSNELSKHEAHALPWAAPHRCGRLNLDILPHGGSPRCKRRDARVGSRTSNHG